MASNNEFYRGKRKKAGPAFAISLVLFTLLAILVLLFYGLQKYIIISDSGLTLELPFLADGETGSFSTEAEAQRSFEPVEIQLTIGETDYDAVEAVAGEGLGELKGVYISAGNVNFDSVNAAVQGFAGENAVVLELKPATGMLAYKSGVRVAEAYGVNGTEELMPIVTSLKSRNIYAVAALSCCIDDALADRYPQLTLKTENGAAYRDEEGAWLDPYSPDLRAYIKDLCTELSAMGFDEILFTNLRHPAADSGTKFIYSGTNLGSSTPMNAVSSFALAVTRSLKASDIRLSVLVSGYGTMELGQNTANGQNVGLLYKVFDRIYCRCTSDGALEEYLNSERFVTLGEAKYRFVPLCYGGAAGLDCWVDTE